MAKKRKYYYVTVEIKRTIIQQYYVEAENVEEAINKTDEGTERPVYEDWRDTSKRILKTTLIKEVTEGDRAEKTAIPF